VKTGLLGAACVGLFYFGPGPASAAAIASKQTLVVCADPNNLPFSNRAGQGFENKLVSLLAKDMGLPVSYVWWAQRRGYVRNTLNEEKCDIWPGVAAGVEKLATTRPYYRSTYMFVTKAHDPLAGLTFDDERLRSLTIGVQMIGDNAMNTPPAHSLARRGLTQNVRGYMLYGDYTKPNPPAQIVEAVAKGEIDVALVWGPLAGYFASRSSVPLRLEAVSPALDARQWPMTFEIAMGVRRDNAALRQQLDSAIGREMPKITALLNEYHIPQVTDRGGFHHAPPVLPSTVVPCKTPFKIDSTSLNFCSLPVSVVSNASVKHQIRGVL
jgi:mxaJ protein